jgi:hypothetical protein
MTICNLEKDQKIIIPAHSSHSKIVATDGFHYTNPIDVDHKDKRIRFVKVGCAIDDNLLITGLVLLVLFYIVGITSGIAFLTLLSVVPILYFLYLYYIKKHRFLHVELY